MVKSIAVAKRSPHNSLNAMAADGINCEDRHCEATRLYTDYTKHHAKQQHLIGKPSRNSIRVQTARVRHRKVGR